MEGWLESVASLSRAGSLPALFQLPFVVLSRADPVRVIRNLFAENDGDAIVNAELYVFHLPLVVWDDSCVGIRGDMVRLRQRANPAPRADQ